MSPHLSSKQTVAGVDGHYRSVQVDLIQHFAQPGCVTMVDLPVLPAVKQEKLSITVCSGELDLRLKLIGCNITSSVKE